ncbi:MAG TPA: helix-turn-helix domain-containing protein, partial [Ottowia sp.]|nr:helix-turn-helix domain-containing protein [Ottowia sp.]
MATEKGVEAVERALSLLDAIPGSGKPSLSLHELSLATGFYKSTILRLTVSLERFGYLRRRDDGRFELGPACARLAQTR